MPATVVCDNVRRDGRTGASLRLRAAANQGAELFETLPRHAGSALASFDWLDTTVALPAGVYRDVFSELSHTVGDGAGARVAELFARFPVALLVADTA